MSQERQLVEQYTQLRAKYEELDRAAKDAKADLDKAEDALTTYMTDAGIKSTAEYDGIGKVRLRQDPEVVFPTIDPERQTDFFDFVRGQGEGDLIKEAIHYKSLCSFLKRKIQEGVALPQYITYGLRQRATWYKPKTTQEVTP